jgi:hypothetical protein
MKAHRYRIHIEELGQAQADAGGTSAWSNATLTFEVDQRDDLFGIVTRIRAATAFADADAIALAVGLKLFTGVMSLHRKDPLFADVQPALRTLIGNLKARVASTTPASAAPPP